VRIGLSMIGQSVLLKKQQTQEEEGGGTRQRGNRIHILDENKETRRVASQAGDERERESGIQGSISCHCSVLAFWMPTRFTSRLPSLSASEVADIGDVGCMSSHLQSPAIHVLSLPITTSCQQGEVPKQQSAQLASPVPSPTEIFQ
jgi:hypothetical protein